MFPPLVTLFFLVAATEATPESAVCDADGETDLIDGCLSLFQRGMAVRPRTLEPTLAGGQRTQVAKAAPTCANLKNQGAFFTVDMKVGTPAQKFEVVADTGSDMVIIPSCVCKDLGGCNASDACFKGTDKSTTFSIMEKEKVEMVQLVFGSGTIDAVISTDVVRMGGRTTTMQDGVLLMVNRALDFDGPFEGILGLGLPLGPLQAKEPGKDGGSRTYKPHLFLEQAGVSHFSVCFSDSGKPGVLRLGDDPAPNPMGTVGTKHWGMDFLGMGVGSASAAVAFCGDPGACSGILDSGTTAMLGPSRHVEQLYSGICDAWLRCRSLGAAKKSEAFMDLLMNCSDWLTDDQGINEVPSLHIRLAGPSGSPQSFELSAWGYITESLRDEVETHRKYFAGVIPVDVAVPTGRKEKVCFPSLGTTDDLSQHVSSDEKAVWILGTPIFYEYRVGYDMAATPPAMSLTALGSDGCGSCDEDLGLISEAVREMPGAARAARPPRVTRGPWRFPRGFRGARRS